MNIGLISEVERINTLKIDDATLSILFAVAQEESATKSENIKFGIHQRMREGKALLNHTRFLGYTKDAEGQLVIVPEEAEIVRKIFSLYLEGNGVRKIKRYLEEHGIRTVTGKSEWSTSTIDRMLSNEKYMGTLLLQKTYTPDFLTGKQVKNRGELIMYMVENAHEAIGEKKVFEACEDAMQELSNILRIVINDMQGTDIFITADHGFLYTYSPLSEGEKVAKSAFSGEVYEVGRRYAITEPDASADFLIPVQLDGEINGTPIKGFTPQDSTRIKISGGGENYVHGGVSLQEIVVPVITFKNLRTTSKKYVEVSNAELKLLSESRKVSNLLFSLDFFQRQPIGDKVQPCAYSVYMTDDEGVVISDRQTIIADRTSTNASERVFRVRFNLKAGAYDKNKIYRLIIANDTDVPEEIEFHIDIAFADDFGFDL